MHSDSASWNDNNIGGYTACCRLVNSSGGPPVDIGPHSGQTLRHAGVNTAIVKTLGRLLTLRQAANTTLIFVIERINLKAVK